MSIAQLNRLQTEAVDYLNAPAYVRGKCKSKRQTKASKRASAAFNPVPAPVTGTVGRRKGSKGSAKKGSAKKVTKIKIKTSALSKCFNCDGTGIVSEWQWITWAKQNVESTYKCRECHGSGRVRTEGKQKPPTISAAALEAWPSITELLTAFDQNEAHDWGIGDVMDAMRNLYDICVQNGSFVPSADAVAKAKSNYHRQDSAVAKATGAARAFVAAV